jgi:polysaccharide biosynthesis protein PslH
MPPSASWIYCCVPIHQYDPVVISSDMGKSTFKTLLYSDLYPLPENIGTRMRTMNFVRYFKKLGEVDLVYHRTGTENNVGQGPFRKEYRIEKCGVSDECRNISRYRDFVERIRRLADRRPWIVADWPKRAIEELNDIVAGDRYDFVLCRYAQDSYPFLHYSGPLRKRIIIDFDDVMSKSLFEAKVPRVPGYSAGLKWHLQRKMLISYQKRFLEFGAALFCSDEDRKEVTGTAGSPNAHLVPNSYPATLNFGTPDGGGYENRRTLLFVGALDYGPNIAGLKWFVRSVFPKVKERYRDLRLVVVGRRPPEGLARICREHPDIELHPDVPDVAPYYHGCGAVVVPLLSGGGTRIKILEAAMAGRCVLSTPIGAYGISLGGEAGPGLFTDEKSFLAQYSKLEDGNYYRECVMKMHAAVQKTYSPEAFDKSMEKVVDCLLKDARGKVIPGSPEDGRSAR